MLILTGNDLNKLSDYNELISAIEKAMVIYEKNNYTMPLRSHINHRDNTVLLMPCFTDKVFSNKLVSIFPGNKANGKPVLNGSVILNSAETGEPLALLDGGTLTALRTGAVGGMGVKYITSESVKTLGLSGAGVQGIQQALFAMSQRNFQTILISEPDEARVTDLKKIMKRSFPQTVVEMVQNQDEFLSRADLIITATNSASPVIPDTANAYENKQFIGIGSFKPDMREFPEHLFRRLDNLFIDTEHAMKESGDLLDPVSNNWISADKIVTIGKLVTGKLTLSKGSVVLFKSVGMALFDLVISDYFYRKALRNEIGTKINM